MGLGMDDDHDQEDCPPKAIPHKKPRLGSLLRIDIEDAYTLDCSWRWGETTYRSGGFSIGRDYLRLEGKTITRGHIKAEHLEPCADVVLGRGAFSTVYLAHLRRDENVEKVAVKQCHLLDASRERRDQLLQELRTLCLADCPALVKLHGAFLEKDTVTTVLEYMDFGSLEALFGRVGRRRQVQSPSSSPSISSSSINQLSEPTAASICFQALVGLSYLHENNILHRDIKPSNLLVNTSGCLKWCDFGISAMDEASCHKSAVGTTVYMSPERLKGKQYGRSSDIWSLGLVVLEALAGQKPPWANVQSIVDLLVTVEDTDFAKDIVPNGCRGRSGYAEELVIACLQHDPAKRIPAKVLSQSPWFQRTGIHGLDEAKQELRTFLNTQPFTTSKQGSASSKRRQPLQSTELSDSCDEGR